MSTDWREKEREFLNGLKADTGRDLAEWMCVIAAQNLPHRNHIIDWLRQQGFMFARASWLERVHHNGGRPIYCDLTDLDTGVEAEEMLARRVAGGGTIFTPAESLPRGPDKSPPPPEKPRPRLASETPAPASVPATPESLQDAADLPPVASAAAVLDVKPEPPPPARSVASVSSSEVEIEAVLARAKAYRPLAQHLLRRIEGVIPGLGLDASVAHIGLSRDGDSFGVVVVSAKDVRLVLRLAASMAAPARFGAIKLPVTLAKATQGMTHMAVLDDARQIDQELVNLVRAAAGC